MTIHSEHPFAPGPEERDPLRRFRGRLAAPVTVVTSGSGDRRTGLTVSSLMVVEGEPGMVHIVVSPNSDLWDVVEATDAFVVHICRETHRRFADVFAGLRPSPGGIFAGITVDDSEWGPVLRDLEDRLYCRLESRVEAGYSGLVIGTVEKVQVGATTDPLVYFRGGYRELA